MIEMWSLKQWWQSEMDFNSQLIVTLYTKKMVWWHLINVIYMQWFSFCMRKTKQSKKTQDRMLFVTVYLCLCVCVRHSMCRCAFVCALLFALCASTCRKIHSYQIQIPRLALTAESGTGQHLTFNTIMPPFLAEMLVKHQPSYNLVIIE